MAYVIDTCEVLGARAHPGSDLLSEIKRIAKECDVRCGVIISLVGSLKNATIRSIFNPESQHLVYDNRTGEKVEQVKVYEVVKIDGPLEIVSATGTISEDSNAHIHVVLSKSGTSLHAGHLMEGSLVYTTVEMFLLVMPNVISKRIFDPETGHKELVLEMRKQRAP
jgi:predicted DNA-binding protein with PD1-like motif